jgi:hypothetical protein
MQLGMSEASPVFRFIREHHLIPGLELFRISHLYLIFAVIGLALLAAAGIDALAGSIATDPEAVASLKEATATKVPPRRLQLPEGLALAALWIATLGWRADG